METQADAAPIGHLKGLLVLAVVVVAVAAFIGISVALGVNTFFGGFLFILYWTTFCHAAPDKFLPGLIGALGGLALAIAVHELPLAYQGIGWAVVGSLILLVIYASIMGWVKFLVNPAFMLFLTVGTIPMVQERAAMADMLLSLLLAGGIVGAALLAKKAMARS